MEKSEEKKNPNFHSLSSLSRLSSSLPQIFSLLSLDVLSLLCPSLSSCARVVCVVVRRVVRRRCAKRATRVSCAKKLLRASDFVRGVRGFVCESRAVQFEFEYWVNASIEGWLCEGYCEAGCAKAGTRLFVRGVVRTTRGCVRAVERYGRASRRREVCVGVRSRLAVIFAGKFSGIKPNMYILY